MIQPTIETRGAGSVVLLNRMLLGVAQRVRKLIESLAHVEVIEAPDPDDVPRDSVDVLIVGRQHINDDLSRRYGYEVLSQAVERGKPRTVIYVIPSAYRERAYRADVAAWDRVGQNTKLFVLEIPRLMELEPSVATRIAADTLERFTEPGVARFLLGGEPVEERLVS